MQPAGSVPHQRPLVSSQKTTSAVIRSGKSKLTTTKDLINAIRESRSSNKLIDEAVRIEQFRKQYRSGKSTAYDKSAMDEQKSRTIWRAFGQYIAK